MSILEALEFAHRHSVIHCNLTPHNVLLDSSDGRWKVSDFGLTMSACYRIYVAPELRRLNARSTAHSDLYAFGVLWAQVLTGHLNGGLSSASLVDDLPHDANPQVISAIQRCLHHDPAQRWHDTRDLLQFLNASGTELKAASHPAHEATAASARTPRTLEVACDGSQPYHAIQQAIDEAAHGDCIHLHPGAWREALVLKSGITIRGDDPATTIIEWTGDGACASDTRGSDGLCGSPDP